MKVTLYRMATVDLVTSDETNLKHLNNHTYITSQKTPNLPLNSDKLDEIKANLMAKSFFMNEIYELKNEIPLVRSLSDGNESKEPKNSHSINVLEIKLIFLEKENPVLRSKLENKHETIDSLLETNFR